MPGKTQTALRIPVQGFAKRTDDTVDRATAILRAKEDCFPREPSRMPAQPGKGKVARDGSH